MSESDGQLRLTPTRWAGAASRWLWPRVPGALGVLAVALLGGVLGAWLAPATGAQVGPLQVQVRVVPSLDPGVRLLLPPAGEVRFATHKAPFAVEGRVAQVDLEAARDLIDSPAAVRALGDRAPEELRTATIKAALTSLLCGVAGALVLSLLAYRRVWRRTAQVAATLAGALVVTGGMAVVTADPAKLDQPRFSGLLSQAPYIAGSVPNVLERLETYRSGLADIVRSVTALYATTGSLPVLSTSSGSDVVTVLHVSDIHLNPIAFDLIDRLVEQFHVDVVIDTGDITTWGTNLESSTLHRIGKLPVPYVFVRGNHDSALTQAAVASQRNAIVLDDRVVQVAGLTIAGIGDPNFTPDAASLEATPERTLPPATTTPAPLGPSVSGPASGPASGSASVTAAAAAPPVGSDPDYVATSALARTIAGWDAAHPDRHVQIAMVHEPYDLQPLLGHVPTVLAGHTHKRATRLDRSGSRIFIEGSTGGAGLTARGLDRLAEGDPLPLAASLIYVARRGPQAGQVIATDAITVGGYGLTSVNLQRTVYPQPTTLRPAVVTPTPTPTPSP